MSPLFHGNLKDKNNRLDLYDLVVHHKDATFFAKYEGEDLPNLRLFNQDILLIDRSVKPTSDKIVIFTEEGDFKIGKLKDLRKARTENGIEIWGVVSYIIHKTL